MRLPELPEDEEALQTLQFARHALESTSTDSDVYFEARYFRVENPLHSFYVPDLLALPRICWINNEVKYLTIVCFNWNYMIAQFHFLATLKVFFAVHPSTLLSVSGHFHASLNTYTIIATYPLHVIYVNASTNENRQSPSRRLYWSDRLRVPCRGVSAQSKNLLSVLKDDQSHQFSCMQGSWNNPV